MAEHQASGVSPTDSRTAELILVEAASLFRRNGYGKATTRDLGHAVGIRGSSVYYHFRSKEEILYGICTESLRRLTEEVTRAADTADGSLARLSAMIEAHVRTLLADRDVHATMLVETRWLSDKLRADVVSRRASYEEVFHGAVADAQKDGAIRADFGSRELTLALLGLLAWTVFWYRPGGSLTAGEIAALLLTLLLEGVVPRDDGTAT